MERKRKQSVMAKPVGFSTKYHHIAFEKSMLSI